MKILKHIIAIIIISLSILSKGYSQTEEEIHLEMDSISKLPPDTNKVIAYNDLIWRISYFDSINSVRCATRSINLANRLAYWKGVATAQKNLGAYYYYHADYQEALKLYKSSLENFEKAKYKKGEAIAYKNLGNIYSQLGNWESALTFYFQSLKLREEINDVLGKAKTLSSIGILFSSVPGYEDSSLVYFNRSLKVFKEVDDKYSISKTYLGISGLYYNIYVNNKNDKNKQFAMRDSAILYARQCIKVSNEIGVTRLAATAYQAVGATYLDVKQYDSAYVYLTKSLKIREENNNEFGIVNSLKALGNFYFQKGDYKNSIKHLKRGLELSKKIETDQVTSEIMSSLADNYFQQKNYKLAYLSYHAHAQLKDSLYNDSKTQEMTQLSMQYEFDKKQKLQELEQQQKDAIQQAKIKRQKLVSIFFIIGFVMMLIFAFFIYKSYKQKAKTNKMLESKNNEITSKNAQLNKSNAEIAAQRDEIDKQKEFVEKQNKEITASINYARRIQRALLTPLDFLAQNTADFFVMYKPRDIVSGDYFWASKLDDKFIVTAADCTGHGVPGAFMSMLGISFLNQIVNQEYRTKSDEITAADVLNKMRDMVVNSLSHDHQDDNTMQEGMDMALAIIDKKTQQINFAGAYNPLVLIRDNELTVVKPDRMPVGYHYIKKAYKFTNQYIDYKPNDRAYLFSDGFQDQFGGEKGKKIGPKRMREIFLAHHHLPMKEQHEAYDKIFEEWTKTIDKDFKQLDDILIIGLKL